MKQGPRRPSEPTPATTTTRRRFLSTVVVGATYTACGDNGMSRGTQPGAPESPPGRRPQPPGGPSAETPPPPTTAPPPEPAGEPAARVRQASDQVVLGATGIQVSRLAMGSGSHGVGGTSSQAELGVDAFARLLVQSYHEQGITFWETADQYGAHPHLKEAIRQVGRDKVVILTKAYARNASQMQADLNRFRMELGIDMIDIVLLHAIESGTWTQELGGAMDALSAAKEKGIIRAHGISCHSLPALRLAARTPWVDVDLARINPSSIHMDADPATVISVLREMKAAGKGVVGMKILGVGLLANRMEFAIGHAMKLDALDAFTIGFTSYAQLQQVTDQIARIPA